MPKRGETNGGEKGERALPAFAARLKALREAAGMTQEQLARRAGLHVGAVFKLEQGTREPTWATVQTLAAALGVDCRAFADTAAIPDGAAESRHQPAAPAPPAEQPETLHGTPRARRGKARKQRSK